MNRIICTVVLLTVFACLSNQICFAESQKIFFDKAKLIKYKTDLFDYFPPTVCVLNEILSESYAEIKKEEEKGGISGGPYPWEVEDLSGGVYDSHQNWKNSDSRVLWVHPDGSVVVALKRGESKVDVYTNNGALKENPPKIITSFILESAKGKADLTWHNPATTALEFPNKCNSESMKDELLAYETSKAGLNTSVSNIKYMVFSQFPYVVYPKSDLEKKVFIHPNIPENEEEVDKGPYLVAGDLVQPVQSEFRVRPKKGYLNVYFRRADGKESMGWVKEEDLIEVPRSHSYYTDIRIGKLPTFKWFQKGINKMNFPGRYESDQNFQHVLAISNVSSKSINVNVQGEECEGEYDLKLVKGRIAQLPDSSEMQRFDLYLFNNAVYLHSLREGLTKGPNFWGIFYPAQK